jgi:hypothetical protein
MSPGEIAELIARDARDVARFNLSPADAGAMRAALSALRQHVDLLAQEVWRDTAEHEAGSRLLRELRHRRGVDG